VHRFNPLSRACQKGINRVRVVLQEEATKRRAAKASGAIYNDAIEWTTAAAANDPVNHGAVQLRLAVAAVLTTSEALRQTLLELCENADVVPELREEVRQAVSESRWTMNALFKMRLLNSCIKESQRTLLALGT
jgi:cytochrome P450